MESIPDFLQLVVNSLTQPFYVINVSNYTIALANEAAGLAAEAGSTTCYALTHHFPHPCGSEDHPCPIVEIKKTGRPIVVEHTHYDAQGNPEIHEVHGFPIFDERGDLRHVVEYSFDITERRRAAAELEDRERMLYEIVELSPVGIGVTDFQGTIIKVNRKFEEMFGYAGEDIPTVNEWYELAYPDEAYRREVVARWENDVRLAIENNTPTPPREYRVRRRDGTFCHVEITMQPGRFRQLVTFVDVTERIKKEEEAVRERKLLDSLRDAQELFIAGKPSEIVFGFLLRTLILLTDSSSAYLDEVLRDEGGELIRKNIIASDIQLEEEAGLIFAWFKERYRKQEPRQVGMSIYALTDRPLFLTSEPGEVGVYSETEDGGDLLALPLIFSGELIGVIGMLGRLDGYNRKSANFLEPFAITCSGLVQAIRSRRMHRELERTRAQLQTLQGLLPICARCKKIRDDRGSWKQIELYLEAHADVKFTHGYCQECMDEMFGNEEWYQKQKGGA